MSGNMLIVVACLATMGSLVNADITALLPTSNTEEGLIEACEGTIQLCISALDEVGGLQILVAVVIKLKIIATIEPLLLVIVGLLVPLLVGTLLVTVVELVAVLLIAVSLILTLVIKVLTGLITVTDFHSECDKCSSDINDKLDAFLILGIDVSIIDQCRSLIEILLKIVLVV